MDFRGHFFSGVYHLQDVRDEKVSLTLAHSEHGEINFFVSDILVMIDWRKKIDRESSSEVHKMWGCLKCKYENCIFIFWRLSSFTDTIVALMTVFIVEWSITSKKWIHSSYAQKVLARSKRCCSLSYLWILILLHQPNHNLQLFYALIWVHIWCKVATCVFGTIPDKHLGSNWYTYKSLIAQSEFS